jgi:hypothetical protein
MRLALPETPASFQLISGCSTEVLEERLQPLGIGSPRWNSKKVAFLPQYQQEKGSPFG